MKKSVLLLVTDLELGGAPLIVKQLASRLDPERFEVTVACLGTVGAVAHDLRQMGIATWCLGARSVWDIGVFYRLSRLISHFRPDILHCSLVHANVVGRLTGSLMQVPHIVASLHTAEQGKRWHLVAENLTCRMSELTICVSDSVANHVHQYSHVPLWRLRVIPNGIDTQRFADAEPIDPKEIGLAQGKTTLIFVGRLDPVKRIDLFLRAGAQLAAEYDLQLLVVGAGAELSHLEALTAELNLQDQVRFTGPRRDVERLLKMATVFVQPSRWEGLPLSALEAMAAGLPIVATRTTGLIDLIEHDKTGLLVPVDNVDELATAIKSVISHPAKVAQLGQAAQEHVHEHFSVDKMVKAYTELFERL